MSFLLWLACTQPVVETPTAKAKPSVLLVTLDTTRADAMGAYGHTGAKTPNFDALAAQGVRFDRAYATVPLTTPSHASMLTGLYPTRHGVHNNGDAILPDDVDTLAEVLKGQGYRSAASVSAFVTTASWNLDQGFDAYFDDIRRSTGSRWEFERPANEVVDDLVGWLPEGEEPFFAWAHFYDAHTPYIAHPETGLESLYDGEIAFVDMEMGRLVKAAREQAGEAGLVVIVVADHGEAFGEHGEHGHGLFVFDSTMRIPFIAVPAQPLETGVQVDQAVSNVDVTPTILGLLGVDGPGDLDGRDLSGATTGSLPELGPVYMESEVVAQRFGFHPEIGLAQGAYKLLDTPSARLFDMAMTPLEEVNVLDEHPDQATALRAFHAQVRDARVSSDAANMGAEVYEQLAALGYVGGSPGELNYDENVDAKDQREVIRQVEEARQALQDKRPKDAERLFEAVLKDHPSLGEVLAGLAQAQNQLGKRTEAEATYKRAIELQPESTLLRVNLANNLAEQGRLDEGYALMKSVHEQVPGDDIARSGILKMSIDMGLYAEAVEQGQAWLKETPDRGSLQAFTGIALVRLGNDAQAKPLLQSSLQDGIPRQLVHLGLATIATRAQAIDVAVSHMEAELAWFPNTRAAHKGLASHAMRTKEWAKARDHFNHLATHEGAEPSERVGWAQALFNLEEFTAARKVLDPLLLKDPNADTLLLHANLLAKEGKKAEGQKVFERAQALKVKEMEAFKAQREAALKAQGAPGQALVPDPAVPAP